MWRTGEKAAYKNLEKNQENIGRILVGGSRTVAGVVVRGDLGWRKLEGEGKKRNYYLDRGCREYVKISKGGKL